MFSGNDGYDFVPNNKVVGGQIKVDAGSQNHVFMEFLYAYKNRESELLDYLDRKKLLQENQWKLEIGSMAQLLAAFKILNAEAQQKLVAVMPQTYLTTLLGVYNTGKQDFKLMVKELLNIKGEWHSSETSNVAVGVYAMLKKVGEKSLKELFTKFFDNNNELSIELFYLANSINSYDTFVKNVEAAVQKFTDKKVKNGAAIAKELMFEYITYAAKWPEFIKDIDTLLKVFKYANGSNNSSLPKKIAINIKETHLISLLKNYVKTENNTFQTLLELLPAESSNQVGAITELYIKFAKMGQEKLLEIFKDDASKLAVEHFLNVRACDSFASFALLIVNKDEKTQAQAIKLINALEWSKNSSDSKKFNIVDCIIVLSKLESFELQEQFINIIPVESWQAIIKNFAIEKGKEGTSALNALLELIVDKKIGEGMFYLLDLIEESLAACISNETQSVTEAVLLFEFTKRKYR